MSNDSPLLLNRSHRLILSCMVIITIFGLLSTIFISHQLYQSNKSAQWVTDNIEQALQNLAPVIDEQRQVNKGIRDTKSDVNRAYAQQKKLLKLLQHSDTSDEIKQPLVQRANLILEKLKSARGYIDNSRRTTDETGDDFRYLFEQLDSIKQVREIDASLKLISTIIVITMSLLTGVLFVSTVVISQGLKRIQSATENALKANNEIQRSKVQTTLAKLTQQLNGEQSIEQLAEHTLNFLAPEMGAGMAGFYERQDNSLSLVQTYAYQGGENRCFELGESIVGQVAAQGKSIELSAPEQKQFGMSKIKPDRLLVTPVIEQDTVLGVIELTLMAPLNHFQQALLKDCLAAFSIAIRSAQYRTNLTQLLDKAQQATRSKSDFLASMSHEIRTPMNCVLGMLHILKATDLTKVQQDYLANIHQSADALLTIINDILDFSKIEAGKIEFEEVPFDLLLMAESILEQLSPQVNDTEVSMQLFFSPDVPRLVIGDPGRIRQILLNLIGNAIKFTRKGYIQLNIERLQGKATKENIEFKVQDSGIGIAEDKLDTIFGRFDQADTSTTREFGGTGLGLAISNSLTQLMGGRMSVSSLLGVGSIFCFNLLLTQQEKQLAFPATILNKIKLLLAAENELRNHMLQKQLTSWGIEYNHVSNAHETMKSLQQGTFDLLIISETLTGLEVINNCPMILLASMTHNKLATNNDENRFVKVLHHPIKASDLLDAITETMHRTIKDYSDTDITTRDTQTKTTEMLLPDNDETIRVLLVEDNHINQEIAKLMLKNQGIVSDIAANGEEALAMLDQFTYSLVFMDCQMPVMDGYTATQKIRDSNTHYANIPIVAMTANAMAGDKEECLAAGMDDYISKPINPQAIANIIKHWVKDNREPQNPHDNAHHV